MKPQAWNELKRKAPEVLGKEVKAHEEKLWSLKVDLAAGKVKNVREIREVKKTIARIKGLLNQQRLRPPTKTLNPSAKGGSAPGGKP